MFAFFSSVCTSLGLPNSVVFLPFLLPPFLLCFGVCFCFFGSKQLWYFQEQWSHFECRRMAGLARGSCSAGVCALPLSAPDEGLKVKMDYLFLCCFRNAARSCFVTADGFEFTVRSDNKTDWCYIMRRTSLSVNCFATQAKVLAEICLFFLCGWGTNLFFFHSFVNNGYVLFEADLLFLFPTTVLFGAPKNYFCF